MAVRRCETCEAPFVQLTGRPAKVCSNCRAGHLDGYSHYHGQERARVKAEMEADGGYCCAIVCLRDSRRIEPGEPFDLGHSTDRQSWHGPEHVACSRSDGAARARAADRGVDPEPPRWSPTRHW